MNPDSQRRNDARTARVDPDPRNAAFRGHALESHLAAAAKPIHHLRAGSEPYLPRFQAGDELRVKVSPEPFRTVAAIVPEERQNAAEFFRVRQKRFTAAPGLGVRQ